MEPALEPIPSPPGHLLREFCHRAMPILVFAAAILATALIWNQRFTGTMLFGEVEPVRAAVTTGEAGMLTQLTIERFQEVTNGQIIAVIQIMDADAVQSSLGVVRSELGVLKARMALDESRNEQSLESIRVRWLEARVEVATARVALETSHRDLERASRLYQDKILSEAEYDSAKSHFDALSAEVRERSTLVEGLSATIQKLEDSGKKERGGGVDIISESLANQEKQLEQRREIKLRSPLTGTVRTINHRPGERLPAGAILTEITARKPERIVGFVRQPMNLEPRPGMSVEIRTRGPKRQVAQSQILKVGTDLETVNSPLRTRGLDPATERGLAFYVDLPPSLEVFPGELVDLVVRTTPRL